MTGSQPKGSETTRDVMEEDLIEGSASLRERARNHLETSTNEKHRQAKVKATRRRKSFRGQRRKWKFSSHSAALQFSFSLIPL